MNVKKKLVELFLNWGGLSNCAEDMADYFIANDVTFAKDNDVPSKWISVTERLPESGVRVIVCRGDKVEQGVFLGVNGWWKVYGTNTKKVTHWKALPQTKADRIRAMSDEELAAWMAECNAYGERADASQWLPWLREPVEVSGDGV